MYESPVNLIYHNIETKINEYQENHIWETIQQVDVVVDKEELVKAIQYDRNQYQKGYNDCIKEYIPEKIEEALSRIKKEHSDMCVVWDCIRILKEVFEYDD